MTPRHPVDKDLKEYLDIRDSRPPPDIEEKAKHKIILSAEHAREELELRLREKEMDTGIHYLSKLDEIRKGLTQIEIDKRIEITNKYKGIIKWIAITTSGIVVVLVSSLVIWFVSQASHVK
jgi:hypothetical protein